MKMKGLSPSIHSLSSAVEVRLISSPEAHRLRKKIKRAKSPNAWELRFWPGLVLVYEDSEFLGTLVPDINIDISGLFETLDTVTSCKWEAPEDEGEFLGPYLSVLGTYYGQNIWLAIHKEPPLYDCLPAVLLNNDDGTAMELDEDDLEELRQAGAPIYYSPQEEAAAEESMSDSDDPEDYEDGDSWKNAEVYPSSDKGADVEEFDGEYPHSLDEHENEHRDDWRDLTSTEQNVIKTTTWFYTADGGSFDPYSPDALGITLETLALVLARTPRYSGHFRPDVPWYSVAEHCVRVSLVEPEIFPLEKLLHDAHEAYTGYGDVIKPVKSGNPDLSDLENGIDVVVSQKFDISLEDLHNPQIKKADLILLATEMRDLMPLGADPETIPTLDPLPEVIVPWGILEARDKFLARYRELRPGAA